MNLLLDTSAFLWLCAGTPQLSARAAKALAESNNPAYVSAVTAWEIGIKAAKGKLTLPSAVENWFPAMLAHHHLSSMPVEADTAIASTKLPSIHSDPFDRLLVALALEKDLTFLTPDELIPKYPGVKTLW